MPAAVVSLALEVEILRNLLEGITTIPADPYYLQPRLTDAIERARRYLAEQPARTYSDDRLSVQRWHSDDAKDEVHYFLAVAPTETYLAGCNPALVPETLLRAFLAGVLGRSV